VVEGVLQETGGGFHEISKNFTANMAKWTSKIAKNFTANMGFRTLEITQNFSDEQCSLVHPPPPLNPINDRLTERLDHLRRRWFFWNSSHTFVQIWKNMGWKPRKSCAWLITLRVCKHKVRFWTDNTSWSHFSCTHTPAQFVIVTVRNYTRVCVCVCDHCGGWPVRQVF
jgi:hypothetical protein